MSTYTFCMLENGRIPDGMKTKLANIFPYYAGKKIRLSISEAKEKRSLEQNSYYWVAIVPHVRKARFDMGDPLSIEQVHEDLLNQFAPRVEATRMDGTVYSRPMRSKEMSMDHMANYITAISGFMAIMGYPVPLKEEE